MTLLKRLEDAWTVLMAMAAGTFLSHTSGWQTTLPRWALVGMFAITASEAYRRIRKARFDCVGQP
jgi:hypothetical protein